MKRRDFLHGAQAQTALALGVASGVIALPAAAQTAAPAAAAGWNKAAFEQKNFDEVAKAFGSAGKPTLSNDLIVQAPEIAENGNVVPLGATSNIPGTTQIAFLVEKNPNVLAASFDVLPGMNPSVSTRVKMGQSSNVYVLAKAGDKYFYAVKDVKVTLGGCGG